MSIQVEISARVDEGRLFLLKPLAPGEGMTRALLMTQPLNDALAASWQDQERFAKLRADLEHFVTGGFIDPNYLKKLKKTEECWEIRSPRPSPSIRIFGRFAAHDVFVATHYHERRPLGGFKSMEWRREIRRCKAEWRKCFPAHQPHTGKTIHDYVSNAADPKLFE